MPIKSKAQRRKFAELLVNGEITPETFEEWNRGAGDAALPERIHPKAPPRRKTASKRTSAAKRKKTTRKTVAKRKPTKRKTVAKRRP